MTDMRQDVRILVVEDDEFIAELIVDVLKDAAYEVVGPFRRVAEAVRAAETETFAAALLDIDLAGIPSRPVAEALARRALPFVFLTGYGKGGAPAGFATRPVVAKPFETKDLIDALETCRSTPAPPVTKIRPAAENELPERA
jgi:DNA-binding response OmpR family regulator